MHRVMTAFDLASLTRAAYPNDGASSLASATATESRVDRVGENPHNP